MERRSPVARGTTQDGRPRKRLAGALALSLLAHGSVLGLAWQAFRVVRALGDSPNVVMIPLSPNAGSAERPISPEVSSTPEEQRAALETTNAALRERIEALTATQVELSAQLAAERQRTTEGEQEITLLRQQEAAQQVEGQQQVAAQQAAHAALEDQVRALTTEKAELAAQLAGERDRTAEGERELQSMVLVRHRETTAQAEHQQELAALGATNASLEQQLDAASADMAELSERLTTEWWRTAELEEQVQEQLRTREAELSEVKGTYERLMAALRSEISQKEIALRQAEERLTVSILDRVLFPSGQAALTPEGRRIMTRVGAILAELSDQRILIEGHTDNVPIGPELRATFQTNWELSTARATEVIKYLTTEVNVPPQRLSASGRADTAPVASNETEAGRRQNRRIEIILLPPEQGPGTTGTEDPDLLRS